MTAFSVNDLLAIDHVLAVNLDAIRRKSIRSVSTDSRTMKHGEAFLALTGPSFDGHRFIEDVQRCEPILCIVSEKWHRRNRKKYPNARFLVVRDTLLAYGDIARAYRLRFDVPIVAITGSNGKTSTKEMIAAVLETKYPTLKTEGNLNNQIGLPGTLLRFAPRHRAAVVELGTNQPGDIPYLSTISRHTHAVVTNIGRAHIERLKSREGIAEEKAAIFRALPPDGVAIVNSDEPYLRPYTRALKNKITYGSRRGSHVRIASVTLDRFARPTFTVESPRFLSRAITISLQTIGRHAAWNATAALTVGFSLGCITSRMVHALESHRGFDKRMEVIETGSFTILNDSYNANPDSMIAALDTLMRIEHSGSRIVALGDMLELGKTARAEHRLIGEHIANLGIPFVLTYGRYAKDIAAAAKGTSRFARHYASKEFLVRDLKALLSEGDVVLVKGSRGMKMEEITNAIRGVSGGAN